MKLEIKKDTFNISQRIKNIDKNYYMVFDTEKKQYEIHKRNQMFNSFCISIPYKELDERTLIRLQHSQHTNIKEIIGEIDKSNMELERENARKLNEKTCIALENNLRQRR